MRLVGLHIQSGGSRRAAAIAAALEALAPDVVVLGEAHPTGHEHGVLDALRGVGLVHQTTAHRAQASTSNAVAIVSRLPMVDVFQPLSGLNGHRLLDATIDDVLVGGGNGFRLDHAFLSPTLAPRLSSAWYDHSVRAAGVSDHSALVVDLD